MRGDGHRRRRAPRGGVDESQRGTAVHGGTLLHAPRLNALHGAPASASSSCDRPQASRAQTVNTPTESEPKRHERPGGPRPGWYHRQPMDQTVSRFIPAPRRRCGRRGGGRLAGRPAAGAARPLRADRLQLPVVVGPGGAGPLPGHRSSALGALQREPGPAPDRDLARRRSSAPRTTPSPDRRAPRRPSAGSPRSCRGRRWPAGPRSRSPVAFLCAEFGIHRSLPIYAGGLGVLAGDILKEASDRALPMVGRRAPLPRGLLPPARRPERLSARVLAAGGPAAPARRPGHRR